MENIDKDIEDLGLGKQQKIDLINLLRTFKKEGLGNFIVVRKEKFENLLSRLKTAERMIELMADFINMYTLSGEENQYCHKVINCEVVGGSKTCIDCIKEWARKKVEDES